MYPITTTTTVKSKPLTDAQLGARVREHNAAKKAYMKALERYNAAHAALDEVTL